MSTPRTAEIIRNTNETKIHVAINLDGTGQQNLATGVPFLDHMLDQIARHGLVDLDIQAQGDLQIDDHHTVEDVGIALGQAIFQAIGDKKGIRRYGHAYVPLDESLSRVVIDFSGRPYLSFHVPFTENAHHQCETVFKAFGRALRMAVEPDPRAADSIPSTKGTL